MFRCFRSVLTLITLCIRDTLELTEFGHHCNSGNTLGQTAMMIRWSQGKANSVKFSRPLAIAALLASISSGLAFAPAQSAAASASTAEIDESILDPARAVEWSSTLWDHMMRDAADAGIDTVTLQSAVTQDPRSGSLIAYYPSTLSGTLQVKNAAGEEVDVVAAALGAAERHGLRVRLGLYRDENNWIGKESPESTDADFTVRLADELWGRYWPKHATLAGWYLPGEVNVNYISNGKAQFLASYYEGVADYLHANNNNMSVMISPDFNADAGQTASAWRSLWATVLERADVDIVALQDGTGDTGRMEEAQVVGARLDTWFGATRSAISDAGSKAQLWTNVNLYQYDGTTAPIDAISANVDAVKPHVSGATSFSYFNQIAPWAVGSDVFAVPFALWNLRD